MNVGIVGCRSFCDYDVFKEKMQSWEVFKEVSSEKRYFREEPLFKRYTIVSGGATGIDTLAEQYAMEFKNNLIVFKVSKDEWSRYGKAAGPRRNNLIVDTIDTLVAFPSNKSKGTWDIISKAMTKGISVYIYWI